MLDLIILAFVMTIVLIPIILLYEFFVRPFQMKRLGKEFGLKYTLHKGLLTLGLNYDNLDDFARNILEGEINGHKIRLFDVALPRKHRLIYTKNVTYSRRQTIIIVDGIQRKMQGKISGYLPIKEISKYLEALNK